MDITPVIHKGRQSITGYGDGKFRIGGEDYFTSVLVFPDRVVEWVIAPGAPITLENLQVVLEEEGEIDLVLIGCGKRQDILPPIIRNELKEVGIAMEVMDTGAACRTYNVLLSEGRRVAAALIAV
ncbi:MAG: Mth938-like domain-containing protein [Alphaproteobacteria bacterium]|nr:Mth938-like domain-containing protein [Alphaproteobacteria bacterium]